MLSVLEKDNLELFYRPFIVSTYLESFFEGFMFMSQAAKLITLRMWIFV